MAFKPSARRTVQILSTELDLRPIMNMMCILIPLLLSCSQFVKNTFLELNLPPISGGAGGGSKTDPKDEKPKLGLKLIITEKGMTIAGNSAVLSGDAGGGPTVPKTSEGKYDYKGLDSKLKEIVKQISGKQFEDERQLNITAEDVIEYQVIVTTMDIIRLAAEKEFRDPSTGAIVKEPWFASVGVGKLII